MIATAAYVHGLSQEWAAALRARRLEEFREASGSEGLTFTICMAFDLYMAWIIFGGGV